MSQEFLRVESNGPLVGQAELIGAKNAVLVTMASTLLAPGKSTLTNVPDSADVVGMAQLLRELGAQVVFDRAANTLVIDTALVNKTCVSAELMGSMRASVLVMGPLLARFGQADVALPGGCVIGARPIDYHVKNFRLLGVDIVQLDNMVQARAHSLTGVRIALEYPSVGATENIMMLAVAVRGVTTIVNASLEPEVLDLIAVLRAMGADIRVQAPMTIEIYGGAKLYPVTHEVLVDRLEAGALLLAGAITGGDVLVPNAHAYDMDVFLAKLAEMGHVVEIGAQGIGVRVHGTLSPRAISFKTAPHPGFPTDLQAPMMVAQCIASGSSEIQETVFESRFLHVGELRKMGAQIVLKNGCACVTGVTHLYGAQVIATDIRASCALMLAGLIAQGATFIAGLHHWRRGYDGLERKLTLLGARVCVVAENDPNVVCHSPVQATL